VASCKRTARSPAGLKRSPIGDSLWHERCNRSLSQGRNRGKRVLFEVPLCLANVPVLAKTCNKALMKLQPEPPGGSL